MFDVAPTELLVLGAVAILVIPPKDLPKAMRIAGYWVGRARGVARQFRSGFDEMLREAELAEMEKKWREENARIMAEHPPTPAMLEGPGGESSSNTTPAEVGAQSEGDGDRADESLQLDSGLRRDGADTGAECDDPPPVMVEQPIVAPAAEPVVTSAPDRPAEPDLFGDLPPSSPPRDPAAS